MEVPILGDFAESWLFSIGNFYRKSQVLNFYNLRRSTWVLNIKRMVEKTHFPLQPFLSAHRQDLGLEAGVRLEGQVYEFTYRLSGDLGKAVIDKAVTSSNRRDELWERTCFEAFVAPCEDDGYWEFNFSPSGDWNIYRFDGYRSGMSAERRVSAPVIISSVEGGGLFLLSCRVDLSGIPELTGRSVHIGLTAVIEHTGDMKSYWALRHAGDRPDFHLRDSFTVLV